MLEQKSHTFVYGFAINKLVIIQTPGAISVLAISRLLMRVVSTATGANCSIPAISLAELPHNRGISFCQGSY